MKFVRSGSAVHFYRGIKEKTEEPNSAVKFRKKTFYRMMNKAMEVLRLDTMQEKRLLKILSTISIFKKATRDINHQKIFLKKIIRDMKIQKFKRGEAIFHYGDGGDKFYIIVKGSVEVYIKCYKGRKKSFRSIVNRIQTSSFETQNLQSAGGSQRQLLVPKSRMFKLH